MEKEEKDELAVRAINGDREAFTRLYAQMYVEI